MVEELLKDYPVVHRAKLSWGDMDVFGMTSNPRYFQYFEDSRMKYFEWLDLDLDPTAHDLAVVVAKTTGNFYSPLRFPDEILVGTRIANLDEGSFLTDSAMISSAKGEIVADCQTIFVTFNYTTREKIELPSVILDKIIKYEPHLA